MSVCSFHDAIWVSVKASFGCDVLVLVFGSMPGYWVEQRRKTI